MSYWVYILECSDGSFYTGITNDLAKRIISHNAGTASKYTRGRTPVMVRYTEEVESRSAALKREAQIKKKSKGEKSKMFNN